MATSDAMPTVDTPTLAQEVGTIIHHAAAVMVDTAAMADIAATADTVAEVHSEVVVVVVAPLADTAEVALADTAEAEAHAEDADS